MILGVVLGAVMGAFRCSQHRFTLIIVHEGLCFSHLMKFSHRKGFIDRESFIAQYLALSILSVGVASTIGTDDLLTAFAAGLPGPVVLIPTAHG